MSTKRASTEIEGEELKPLSSREMTSGDSSFMEDW